MTAGLYRFPFAHPAGSFAKPLSLLSSSMSAEDCFTKLEGMPPSVGFSHYLGLVGLANVKELVKSLQQQMVLWKEKRYVLAAMILLTP